MQIMHITRKTTRKITHPYYMESNLRESVSYTKYLGVTISEDLRWNRHVAKVICRANKLLGLLRRNLSACDRKVKEDHISALLDRCSNTQVRPGIPTPII